VSGDVQTKDSVKVINRNAFDMEVSVNGATITKRKVKKDVPLNVIYQKKTLSMYSPKRKIHKILVIGDNHVRNCATQLQQNLDALKTPVYHDFNY
jgi:muramidase (phage lysozyme)